jgi:DNA adenine methylase
MNRLSGPTKPILRWAGSKRKLLGKLKGFWRPHHRRYVEPFAGSACLFFELEPRRAILGDSNAELIQLYRLVKTDAHALYARLCRIPRDAATYYRWRSKDPDALDEQTRALRFLYLNRNCFNGIFRTNIAGQFNVPFGAKHGKPIGKLEKADYIRAAEQLTAARLIAGDFSKTLELVKAGDFVYLDPPFAVSSKRRRLFTEYGKNVFGPSDVERLAVALSELDKEGADFLVSYADCKEARFLARNWNAKRLSVRRHIAGFSAHRKNASEWLITNCQFPETHDQVEVING